MIREERFGILSDGREVKLFTLENKNGYRVAITNAAAAIQAIYTPDRNGNCADIVLGYDKPEHYFSKGAYHGAVVGRVANRIEDARFTLNGQEYILKPNFDGRHMLHGGEIGLDSKLYDTEIKDDTLILKTIMPNGEDGFPGNVDLAVIYQLDDDNRLITHYIATSDEDTPLNLINHTYFNLAGHTTGDVLNQKLLINANEYYPLGNNGMVTGEIAPVRGTIDFRKAKTIGQDINKDCTQLNIACGYDHNYDLPGDGKKLVFAAQVWDEKSSRTMKIFTDMPGILFYSGNHLQTHPIQGKNGAHYKARNGFCLETNFCPNALKFPHLKQPILRKGEVYDHSTIYQFGIE